MLLTSLAVPDPTRDVATTESTEVLRKRVAGSGRCMLRFRPAGLLHAPSIAFHREDDPWAPVPDTGVKGANAARRACAGCPVQASCLELALREEARLGGVFGVRGGLAADEREALIRMRKAATR